MTTQFPSKKKSEQGVNDCNGGLLGRKCLRMRPHFPVAEPRTASETRTWFLCCPQLYRRCVSRPPAPVLLLDGPTSLLCWWQTGRNMCVVSSCW